MIKTYKLLMILILILNSLAIWGQNQSTRENERNKVIEDFKNINPEDLPHLIPFKIKGKYGLYNFKTEQEVVKPEYKELELYSNGGINGFLYKRNYQFKVKNIDGTSTPKFVDTDEILITVESGESSSSKFIAPKESSEIIGFVLNSNGKVKLYSSKFGYSWTDKPFKISGKYYIIVSNKKKGEDYRHGVIDMEGQFLKGFEFEHVYVYPMECPRTELIWFLFVDKDEFLGMKSSDNNVKFYKEMGKLRYLSDIAGYPDGFTCYKVFKTENGDGIMDFTEMKWLLKPQKKLDIWEYVKYSSTKNFTPAGRVYFKYKEFINNYFWVRGEDIAYYLDIKLNKLIPKKYLTE